MARWHPLPTQVYSLVQNSPATVLLHNAQPAADSAISRLFTAPRRQLIATHPQQLPALFQQIQDAIAAGAFAAGYFAYECGAAFEPSAAAVAPSGQPIAWFGIYAQCHLFSHAAGAFLGDEPPGLAAQPPCEPPAGEPPPALTPALTLEQYAERIAAIHEWIRAGDVYQLNFTFPLRARTATPSAQLYAGLIRQQPARYAAFLHTLPGSHILSFSPELFFRLEEQGAARRITTQPMKGTAPRGRTNAEDAQLAAELASDPKSRAENVMIVDLLRNDLGRLCRYGSVHVPSLFQVERLPTLWQMTSTITGTLPAEVGPQQVFRALFPCGSVTGAPKVRAMQLIGQLEDGPRGVYTGSIGYFSRERSVFNVAIRTLEQHGEACAMGIGSGVVIDSRAGDEYRECLLKAEFLTHPRPSFSLVETLLWQGGYPFLELHLDRLQDSAYYFRFPCERTQVKNALLATANSFPDASPRKVRLVLEAEGALHIQHEVLASAPADQPVRVCVASQRTRSTDCFYFHKTTHRPLYASALQAATQAGFDEVLFLNERDEVTEGAISNLFAVHGGRWSTPPIGCGVLPGVYRRHLLAERPQIEERILRLADLQSADALYLANAVRGLRRVTLHAVPLP